MEDELLLTLNRLREEHRMLDDEIFGAVGAPLFRPIADAALKKRKLWLKDTITRVEAS
ncbi:MAG: YdcH family protein [Cellvibrionales bacterium]|nr:YdcH family protein [Cellvibrionales bacterium]